MHIYYFFDASIIVHSLIPNLTAIAIPMAVSSKYDNDCCGSGSPATASFHSFMIRITKKKIKKVDQK